LNDVYAKRDAWTRSLRHGAPKRLLETPHAIRRRIVIEQYFKAGVRFLWNKPNDAIGPTDGAIVNSVNAATNLSYDGLDAHPAVIDPALQGVQVGAVLGLAKGQNVPHAWLDYAPGRVARLPAGGGDILTGYMSGCLIARGTHAGAISAFHVGTIVGNAAVNQTVKRSFAANLPPDATAFNPAGAWNPGEVATIQQRLGGGTVASDKIFALVTPAGTFYSLLMFNVQEAGSWTSPTGQRYWCVGGIKQVPAMTRVTLMASLLS
jgi:hypothetical protein